MGAPYKLLHFGDFCVQTLNQWACMDIHLENEHKCSFGATETSWSTIFDLFTYNMSVNCILLVSGVDLYGFKLE